MHNVPNYLIYIFKLCVHRSDSDFKGEGDQIFYFFYVDIRNKKVCKVKNLQVWDASRYLSKRQRKREGEAYSAPPPHGLRGKEAKKQKDGQICLANNCAE